MTSPEEDSLKISPARAGKNASRGSTTARRKPGQPLRMNAAIPILDDARKAALREGLAMLEPERETPKLLLDSLREDIRLAAEKGVSAERIAEYFSSKDLPLTARQIRPYLGATRSANTTGRK